MRAFRLGAVELVMFRIPGAALLDSDRDFRRFALGPDTTGLERVRSWTHTTTESPPYAWREEMLGLGDDLGAGVYVLVGRAPGVERRVIFFVSDLGLLVKRSAGKILISAASLKTGLAIEGARVSAMPIPTASQEVRTGMNWSGSLRAEEPVGSTDDDGLLVAPATSVPAALRVVAVSEGHGVAVAESPLAPAVEGKGDQVFLYTERPIYRPAQTVYWKAFAR